MNLTPTPNQFTKIDKASAQMVTRMPFYASIFHGMPRVPTTDFPTLATDGKAIYYNPAFIETLSVDEVMFAFAHECEHVARLHPWRMEHRSHKLWNAAGDYVINHNLKRCNMTIIDGALLDNQYADDSEEQAYAKLEKKHPPKAPKGGQGQPQQGQGESVQGSGRGDPDDDPPQSHDECLPAPGDPAQAATDMAEMRVKVIQAAKAAKMQGKLPAHIERMVEEIVNPPSDWKEQLRRYMTAKSHDDYSWSRANRRLVAQGIYMPARQSEGMGPVVVVVDTSGSIGPRELGESLGHIRSICEDTRPSKIVLMDCDTVVNHVVELDDPANMGTDGFTPKGGGGTDFRPPFVEVEKLGITPECLVYLTDGEGSFPPHDPGYPVVWGHCNTRAVKYPFGHVVDITGA